MAIISSATKLPLERRTRLPPPAYAHPEALWTGRQLIEMMLPPVSMVHGKQERLWEVSRDDGSISTVAEHPLVVRRGRFLSGQFNKATLGTSSGSLVHHVLLAVGNAEAVAFMGDLQRVINRWLLERGFSIGIGDCVPSKGCDATMHTGIDRVLRHIDKLQTEVPQWSSVTLDDGDSGRTSLESIAVARSKYAYSEVVHRRNQREIQNDITKLKYAVQHQSNILREAEGEMNNADRESHALARALGRPAGRRVGARDLPPPPPRLIARPRCGYMRWDEMLPPSTTSSAAVT